MPRTRLPRGERREQILAAATVAFARGGFDETVLSDVAEEAGVSRVILYRHFDTKADLYLGVLTRARDQLRAAVGEPDYDDRIVEHLLAAAARDPAGFRLLFQQLPGEPEFRRWSEDYRREITARALEQVEAAIPDPAWAQWAAQLVSQVTTTAIIAWLDAGQPDPADAARRVTSAVAGILRSAAD